jgi:hypothetical protein
MKKSDDEKLTHLLRQSGPGTIPTLEPDPHLPARIRAMARENVRLRAAKRRGWVPVSLGATALAVAVAIGSYIGYTAGTSMASRTLDVAQTDETTQGLDAFWDAWSQSGFGDDLATVETNGESQKEP